MRRPDISRAFTNPALSTMGSILAGDVRIEISKLKPPITRPRWSVPESLLQKTVFPLAVACIRWNKSRVLSTWYLMSVLCSRNRVNNNLCQMRKKKHGKIKIIETDRKRGSMILQRCDGSMVRWLHFAITRTHHRCKQYIIDGLPAGAGDFLRRMVSEPRGEGVAVGLKL